jgi:hypothetical protein
MLNSILTCFQRFKRHFAVAWPVNVASAANLWYTAELHKVNFIVVVCSAWNQFVFCCVRVANPNSKKDPINILVFLNKIPQIFGGKSPQKVPLNAENTFTLFLKSEGPLNLKKMSSGATGNHKLSMDTTHLTHVSCTVPLLHDIALFVPLWDHFFLVKRDLLYFEYTSINYQEMFMCIMCIYYRILFVCIPL